MVVLVHLFQLYYFGTQFLLSLLCQLRLEVQLVLNSFIEIVRPIGERLVTKF
jgi:hypothetical protein